MDEYVISVTGDGLLLRRSVPRAVAEKLVVEVLTEGNGVFGQVETGRLPTDEPLGLVGMHEFARPLAITRSIDRILVVGVYLAQVRGVKLFEREDVVAGLEEMAEPVPKNLSRDIAWAVRIGWIARKEGVRGVYYVAEEGFSVVEQNFPSKLLEKTTLGRRRKK